MKFSLILLLLFTDLVFSAALPARLLYPTEKATVQKNVLSGEAWIALVKTANDSYHVKKLNLKKVKFKPIDGDGPDTVEHQVDFGVDEPIIFIQPKKLKIKSGLISSYDIKNGMLQKDEPLGIKSKAGGSLSVWLRQPSSAECANEPKAHNVGIERVQNNEKIYHLSLNCLGEYVELLWVGDLNGDNHADFLIKYGSKTDWTIDLFLSAETKSKTLMKAATYFYDETH